QRGDVPGRTEQFDDGDGPAIPVRLLVPEFLFPRRDRARHFAAQRHRYRQAGFSRGEVIFFPLPLWEKVARMQSAPDEGSRSVETDPSPVRDAKASRPPSPTRGEGKISKKTSGRTRRHVRHHARAEEA